LLGNPQVLGETLAAQRDTGVGVFDLEIVRIGEAFDPHTWDALFEAGAALNAKAILVAGDDTQENRLADNYARLCQVLEPFGLTANLEFMPWTAVPHARAAMQVLERAGRPVNAGILVDALHFGRSQTTLNDIRAIPRQWLHYAQICDAPAGTHFSTEQMIHTARCARELPGQGSIDLQGLFAALPDNLPISVEVVNFEHEAQTTPSEWAARCLQASRSVLER
jgi:sugar phosphate isomerase/epimerase